MYFVKRHRYLLAFLGVLVFCSVMIMRQIHLNQSRHVEMREAFILLHARGYTNEASRLFNRLVNEVHKLSTRELMDDWQRTIILVDPSIDQPKNLIWRYHWTVSNELEKRTEDTLKRALKLAGSEEK